MKATSHATSTEESYYLADGLGSTMATVDSDGDVIIAEILADTAKGGYEC